MLQQGFVTCMACYLCFLTSTLLLQVIHSLDPKKNLGTGPEVLALKNQLSEKERLIEHMEVT